MSRPHEQRGGRTGERRAIKLPEWFVDAGYKLPSKFPMSLRGDGYCKSIEGKMRWICGKIPPQRAVLRLRERDRNGDFDEPSEAAIGAAAASSDGSLTVKQLSNRFLEWLRQRIETRRPKPFGERCYDDYVVALQVFANTTVTDQRGRKARLADLPAVSLGPAHFSAYVKRIPGRSPYTFNRFVAAVSAMYSYANDSDAIPHPVKFGADFKRQGRDELGEARADLQKEFSRDELHRILNAAAGDPLWLAMVLLGVNAAYTNIDLAKLEDRHVDFTAGVVQLKRGKKGRALRRCPLWPETLVALRAYREVRVAAAAPEYEPRLFRTRTGLPLVRQKRQAAEGGTLTRSKRINAAGDEFKKVLVLSKLPPAKGRSLSGLRTTFRTVAEHMPNRDDAAIDLVMGHSRKHISREYVERFPVENLHRVVNFVWVELMRGWSTELPQPPAAASSSPVAAGPAPAAA